MNEPELMGTCDTCDTEYDISSRAGRCGDCGECSNHCEHLTMAKYTIKVSRHYAYQIEVEATDEMAAYQEARNWEIEDLEPYEIKAWFDTDVISVKEAN